jgi:phosphoenolpyruvate-protein kinase (PTS system EI component)
MLRSGSILRDLRNELQTELLNAEQVVKRVLRRIERRFQEAAQPTIQDRADDIADLARRLLAALAGTNTAKEKGIDTPSLARAEWEHIQRVLSDCGGNISEAARRLGIHRRSLQRKLQKYPPAR